MSEYQAERRFLRGACRDGEAYRWSTAVRVQTAITMHERGEDVPVSGDAGLIWIGQSND